VRQAISLLFDTFTATGSAFAVVRAFRQAQLTFPARHRGGPITSARTTASATLRRSASTCPAPP